MNAEPDNGIVANPRKKVLAHPTKLVEFEVNQERE